MELFTPEFGLIFWMFVVFAIMLFILAKYAWPAIVKNLNERADLIDHGVTYAQDAKKQLDNAKAENQRYIDEAHNRQTEILREAMQMKSKIVEEAKTAAQKEAQKVMEQAKISIERERKNSEVQLRKEIGEYAIQIAEKVIRGQLSDKKSQSTLIEKMINDIEVQS